MIDNIDMDRYPCPCCGNLTLDEEPPGTWLICEVCCWEDDPVQFEDPEYRGGANGPSLNEARRYFRTIGFSARSISPACDVKIRPVYRNETLDRPSRLRPPRQRLSSNAHAV